MMKKNLEIIASVAFLTFCSTASFGGTIRASSDLCAAVAHSPRDDVTYRSGVDVKGKPVVPADLNTSVIPAPKIFFFDISKDLEKVLNDETHQHKYGHEAILGQIEARKNGAGGYDLFFDGQPLNDGQAAALAEVCGE